MTVTVSLVILTWNRKQSVGESLSLNLANAGYPIREIIHVDNGSDPGFCEWFKETFKPDVQICHKTNLGVAVGYNRGLAMATSSHVVITGCDRVMPDNWLYKFAETFHQIPNTGVVSCYTGPHTERYRGDEQVINGIPVRRSIPVEARMHSKEFLFRVGFWREDFGLYGYEDSEWSDRAEKRAIDCGLLNIIRTDMGYAQHLPCDDFGKKVDDQDYQAFKDKTHGDPRRKALWLNCHKLNSPYYNPYSRIEPNLLGSSF